jgi:hypothetical protein
MEMTENINLIAKNGKWKTELLCVANGEWKIVVHRGNCNNVLLYIYKVGLLKWAHVSWIHADSCNATTVNVVKTETSKKKLPKNASVFPLIIFLFDAPVLFFK